MKYNEIKISKIKISLKKQKKMNKYSEQKLLMVNDDDFTFFVMGQQRNQIQYGSYRNKSAKFGLFVNWQQFAFHKLSRLQAKLMINEKLKKKNNLKIDGTVTKCIRNLKINTYCFPYYFWRFGDLFSIWPKNVSSGGLTRSSSSIELKLLFNQYIRITLFCYDKTIVVYVYFV